VKTTCTHSLETAEPTTGNYFVSTYPPFSCWTAAATEEARRRLERPAPADAPPLGLYVHIPFCVDRCHYCYYLSHDNQHDEIDRYLEALPAELARYAATPYLAGRRPAFVYFGGGTPSLLSTARVRRLLAALRATMPWDEALEVSFECAPRSVSEEKLRVLSEGGVTRLSLGIQQLDDDVLEANGRVHRVADVERAYRSIRSVGFAVVNVDLIVGLVGETESSYRRSLDRIVEMAPDSVTIYQLEIPLNTPLARSLAGGELTRELPDWETKHARLRAAMGRLEAAGYTVTSAYAAVRDARRHRFIYQAEQYRGADLLGIGTSSFSHLDGSNQQNEASLSAYLDRVEDGRLPLSRAYLSTAEERMIREFVLQLKLGRVERRYFERKFGVDLVSRFSEPLHQLAAQGWLAVDDTGIALTRAGLPRVDRMLPGFYRPEHRGLRYS
jgi:oxygen-independent coproporphyrinogen-3 oxidase